MSRSLATCYTILLVCGCGGILPSESVPGPQDKGSVGRRRPAIRETVQADGFEYRLIAARVERPRAEVPDLQVLRITVAITNRANPTGEFRDAAGPSLKDERGYTFARINLDGTPAEDTPAEPLAEGKTIESTSSFSPRNLNRGQRLLLRFREDAVLVIDQRDVAQ
jgi:hypothetical protein